jgi:hypothetical protein
VLPATIGLVASLPWAVADHVMMRQGFIALWLLSAVLVGFAGLDRGYVLSFPIVAPALEYIGSRSYSLYLTHVLAGRVVEGLRSVWPAFDAYIAQDREYEWRKGTLAICAALLSAEALYRFVERPFMRVGRTLTDPSREGPLSVSKRARWGALAAAGVGLLLYYRHPIELAIWSTDLAFGKLVLASSHWDGKPPETALTNGVLEPEFGLHTQEEAEPWAIIDLGQPTRIGSIRVYNRADGYEEQALPLEVQISMDGVSYTTVAWQDRVFTQAWPWRIRLKERTGRYVRLRVGRESVLCLSEVEVFGDEGPAMWP